jgi:Rrf2 family protein
MKISSGVEWAAHACSLLAVLPEGWALSSDALAEYHGLPPAYMAKQMQLLSRSGLVVSQRGAAGGYRLARPAAEVTLWDVMAAIEGREPSFRCGEIRRNGPCGSPPEACTTPCGIAASFYQAEAAFRDSLSRVTLVEAVAMAAKDATIEKASGIAAWIQANAVRPAAGAT